MIEQYAQSLAHYLQASPNMGGLITFIISFLESLAVVGTIVPGSVTMTAVGVLIGTGILPLGMTFFWAVLGAFIGDVLGYWLGSHYNERLRSMWPFKSRPQWLEAGENFFKKHGGKSILIGRFIGPLRSLIPMIAGILHMPWQKFILAAIPAAALWAIVYMLPGILLGALSLQLPPSVATKFILILLLIIVLVSVFAWLIKYLFIKWVRFYEVISRKAWQALESSHHFSFIPRLLGNSTSNKNHQQLTWLILAVLFAVLFSIIFWSVSERNAIVFFNRPIFEFLRTIRHASSDNVFIGITLLGDGRVLLCSGLIILAWLFWKKATRAAIHWLIALLLSVTVWAFIKWVFYFPRPAGLLHASRASSFPSGHTFQAMMFFGFIAILIASHVRQKYRRYPYLTAAIIVVMVGFSRLYLGVHWLTDAVASICIGYTCLALLTVSYRRKSDSLNVGQFALTALICLAVVWGSFYTLNLQKNITRYSLLWPSKTIVENAWWGQLNTEVPLFRQNRIGKPSEPMNIQYQGDIQQLRNRLVAQGWRSIPDVTLVKSTLQKLTHTATSFSTLLPSVYLNHPPILFMTKDDEEGKLILRIWDSNIYFANDWDPLYVGNVVKYEMDPDKETIIYSFNVTAKILPYLQGKQWRFNSVAAHRIPKPLAKKNWEGEILQISAPPFY